MKKFRVSRWAPSVAMIGAVVACSSEGSDSPSPNNSPSEVETPANPAPDQGNPANDPAAVWRKPTVLGTQGWQVQSSAIATQTGAQVSAPDFNAQSWLQVKPDDAGAPGTEINALVQNGECPNVYFSDNMRTCFGFMQDRGPVTVKRFAVPWWFRTTFTPSFASGQHAKLIINGVVGAADVWVNGTKVAGKDVVTGAFARRVFDVSSLVRSGTNALAIEMYPNDPTKMFTVDNVDWAQIPPDNETGIQFPVELQVSDALSNGNAHVLQNTASDLSSSALTVKTDVTNDSGSSQTGTVSATITPPSGQPIVVQQSVTVAAHTTTTVSFTPDKFPSLNISHPAVWFPYLFGAQPLYGLSTQVAQNGKVSTTTSSTFGIRTVSSRLVGKSSAAPSGARLFGINGKEFVYRGGGYSPDLLLRYSKSDVAHQIALIKNLGFTGIRIEGHDMPQDFYDQMDRAGVLVVGGFTCCNRWELPEDGSGVTDQDYQVIHDSSVSIGQNERNHPSVFNYGWSDNNPIPRQETEVLSAFKEADFDVPLVASAEYKSTPTLGSSGEKEGPYDWVSPSYWYDTTHFDSTDASRTNAGGSWGFDSEQSAGDTVPTLDSLRRFLSPNEQAKLWQQPDFNQYHCNMESGHGGYAFGTLFVFDQALTNRYGQWSSLESYVKLAQAANYENVRSQFEAFIDHSTNTANPATGVIYWQLNKGWPTLLWSLYNNDGDQPGSFFGAKKANEPLHALYTYDDGTVTLDNLGADAQHDLSVDAKVYDIDGNLLDHQTASGITLNSQQVKNKVLKPKAPATTKPPAKASVYFVELLLSQSGKQVDRNVYWMSTQQDLVNWSKTLQAGNAQPQATMSQYANLQALQGLAKSAVKVTASTSAGSGPNGADTVTQVTITNTSSKPVAFFLRADVRRGTAAGGEQPGDNQVAKAIWDDNDIALWPGESQTLTASYSASDLQGAAPVVSVSGWNTDRVVVAAPNE